MIKVKRAIQINSKEEGVKILEDTFCVSEDNMNQSKLDQWISEIENGEIDEWTVHDVEKWNGIKDRYIYKFEDKIELLDRIMADKKGKVKVTWISIFKEKKM
ncbi:MAG TPA: hypothetical protein VF324_02710 [Methanobacterium sp.]